MTRIQTEKVRAVRFVLTRLEGPLESNWMAVADTWAAANRVLRAWAATAPTGGGYDKCEIAVEYADGETYTARYALKCHDVTLADLGRHIRQVGEFYAGQQCPAHLTQAQYHARLNPETKAQYAHFLDGYEIEEGGAERS